MQEMTKETNEKVYGITSDQRKAYKQMLGEDFKMTQPSFGGFGGGAGQGYLRQRPNQEQRRKQVSPQVGLLHSVKRL